MLPWISVSLWAVGCYMKTHFFCQRWNSFLSELLLQFSNIWTSICRQFWDCLLLLLGCQSNQTTPTHSWWSALAELLKGLNILTWGCLFSERLTFMVAYLVTNIWCKSSGALTFTWDARVTWGQPLRSPPPVSVSRHTHRPRGCSHAPSQGIRQLCTHAQCHKWGTGHVCRTKRPPSSLSLIPYPRQANPCSCGRQAWRR